jgi:hypothetical protein|tara:strand:+ start:164 stop:1555 length:1392 start_codon:yes stop_codon:yes gene_type:complete
MPTKPEIARSLASAKQLNISQQRADTEADTAQAIADYRVASLGLQAQELENVKEARVAIERMSAETSTQVAKKRFIGPDSLEQQKINIMQTNAETQASALEAQGKTAEANMVRALAYRAQVEYDFGPGGLRRTQMEALYGTEGGPRGIEWMKADALASTAASKGKHEATYAAHIAQQGAYQKAMVAHYGVAEGNKHMFNTAQITQWKDQLKEDQRTFDAKLTLDNKRVGITDKQFNLELDKFYQSLDGLDLANEMAYVDLINTQDQNLLKTMMPMIQMAVMGADPTLMTQNPKVRSLLTKFKENPNFQSMESLYTLNNIMEKSNFQFEIMMKNNQIEMRQAVMSHGALTPPTSLPEPKSRPGARGLSHTLMDMKRTTKMKNDAAMEKYIEKTGTFIMEFGNTIGFNAPLMYGQIETQIQRMETYKGRYGAGIDSRQNMIQQLIELRDWIAPMAKSTIMPAEAK